MNDGTHKRILIAVGVGDSDEARTLVTKGYSLDTACSLDEAAEMLSSGVYSAALVDAGTFAALLDSEHMHRNLVERSNDGVVVLQDGLIKFVNPRFVEMSGYTAKRLLNSTFTDYMTRAEAAVLEERYRRRMAGEYVPAIYETSLTRRGGRGIPLELSAAVVPFGGRPSDLVLVRDISDRKAAEEYLRRYRQLFESARDIILFVDPDCSILDANRAAIEAYGYSHDELLAMCARDLRAAEVQHSLPEVMKQAEQEPVLYETIHRRRDGSKFPVEVSLSSAAIRERPVFLGIVRDITERKLAQTALENERRRLRSVLDAIPVAVMIADSKGGYVEANEQADVIWGGPIPHVQSVDDYDEFTGWQAETGKEIAPDEWAMSRALTEGVTTLGEMVSILRFDGKCATILNSAAPVKDAEGQIIGGVVAEQDITELVELREALERSLQETERESWRASVLESIAEAGLSFTGLTDLLDTLAGRIAAALSVEESCIFVLDEEAQVFEARAVYNVPGLIGCRVKPGEGFVGKVALERGPVYVDKAGIELHGEGTCDTEGAPRSMLGVPLIARGRVLGVTRVQSLSRRKFSPEDVRLLQAIADRAAMAIDNAKLYDALQRSRSAVEEALEREKHFSLLLQQALLPANPTVGEGYSVAVRYVPAFVGREVGGDFYDVFSAGNSRAGILIGDVLGKGLEAASLAATTRSTIHAFVHEHESVDSALTKTNSILESEKPALESFVTVCLVTLDVPTGEIRYCSAGHPPPALCRADGSVEFLSEAGLPLGVLDVIECDQVQDRLEPGDKLILYTDGISEAHAAAGLFDLEGIEKTLLEHAEWTPEETADGLIEAATQWADGKLRDDAAVVVVSRTA